MEPAPANANDKLMSQEWRTEEDYKRMIVALEIQNEKYRNELYELGETVNKILDKTRMPQSHKLAPPNMEQQLELVRKELHNVNQFIEIYQRELHALGGKKKKEQIENLASTQELLKAKTEELAAVRKEVKEMAHKNKALQAKLTDYNRRNRAKSFDQQANQLKDLVNENKNLKSKLEQLENMQQKKGTWLKNNIQSAKDLELKIQNQEQRLPKIELKRAQRSSASLPKLQNEKKIYMKLLESSREKGTISKLEKELQDLEKINRTLQEKVKNTTKEIQEIEDQVSKVKEKVEAQEAAAVVNQPVEDIEPKSKDIGCMVFQRPRRHRRDWVGKFDSLRFSDSRTVREESRLFRIVFNSAGYFQFQYYLMKDPKITLIGKVPFDFNAIPQGRESVFAVENPDFVKNIRVKINMKTQRILEVHVLSNLGIQGEFVADVVNNQTPKNQSKVRTASEQTVREEQVNYEMDIKANEAISCVFGSYGCKLDEKKNIVGVWLQGLGVELVDNFVEELI